MTDNDPVSNIEFMQAMLSMARLTRAYYTALIDEGFTEAIAIEMVKVWLNATIQLGKQ